MEQKSDSYEEQTLINRRREIFLLFSDLVAKFKENVVVSPDELLAFSTHYCDFSCLFDSHEEDETIYEKIQQILPPMAFISQCFGIQQQHVQPSETPGDSKSSVDKNNVAMDFDLLHKMKVLFEESPIKNLNMLLDLYAQYVQYVNVDANLEDGESSFEAAKEHQDLLHYLDVESRRADMTARLVKRIDLYRKRYDSLMNTGPSPLIISILDSLYHDIQNTKFDPYITKKQSEEVNEIQQQVELLCNRVSTEKNKHMPAGKTFFSPSLRSSPASLHSESHIIDRLPFIISTPLVESPAISHMSTLSDLVSPFLSPLETKQSWGKYHNHSIPYTEQVSQFQSSLNRTICRPLELEFNGSEDSLRVHEKNNFVPINPQTTSSRRPLESNLKQPSSMQHAPKAAKFSLAFWLRMTITMGVVSLAVAVTAILLLLLASSLTSHMAVAGWACAGASVGLFFACRYMSKSMMPAKIATEHPGFNA